MSTKKYNHYVPKFYLANFSGSKDCIDKCLLSSQRIIRNAPTKSTGGKDYLYGKDGIIEDAFCEMEGHWATIIEKIITNEELPTDSDSLQYLLYFIILSDARTLATANNTLDFWATQYQTMATVLKKHGRLDIPDEMIPCISAEAEIPNLFALEQANDIFDYCLDLQLSLIKNISNLPFISSDNPVAKYNQFFVERKYYRSYGYGHMGLQIFLPLSPKLCLVLYDPVPYRRHFFYGNKFIVNEPTAISAINTLIAGYANQEIYFSKVTSDRTINKILKNRVDKPLSPASASWGAGDHYLVFKSEPSYFHHINCPLFSLKKPFREMTLPAHMGGPLRPRARMLSDKEERNKHNNPNKKGNNSMI